MIDAKSKKCDQHPFTLPDLSFWFVSLNNLANTVGSLNLAAKYYKPTFCFQNFVFAWDDIALKESYSKYEASCKADILCSFQCFEFTSRTEECFPIVQFSELSIIQIHQIQGNPRG